MAATKAREVMTPDTSCVGENDTALDAAKRMKDEQIGALPICGEDDRLKGMITDRDITVSVVAEGRDPSSTRVGDLAQGEVVTIGADDDIDTAIQTMVDHGVRRLPVIDGHRMVGVVSQADLARELPPERAGELLAGISEQPSDRQ
ncbi:MAG: histidine kinase [Solirubrobacterales bacterium]|nr:histidine kinase [Solirubrobacterales bacterium]